MDAAGNNYGCLALVVDPDDVPYVKPTEPPHYDATIDINTMLFNGTDLSAPVFAPP